MVQSARADSGTRLSTCLVVAGVVFAFAPLLAAAPPAPGQSSRAGHRTTVASLRDDLAALSPKVRAGEAERVASRAYETSQRLARDYGIKGPPQFHNFLVNAGLKERGLCHHWARDLMQQLRALKLTTLDLHWGGARAGTLREHNAVIVTAKGQPFQSGIVLDAWRHSGRLFSGPVAADRYPWKEDLTECFCARSTRYAGTAHKRQRR